MLQMACQSSSEMDHNLGNAQDSGSVPKVLGPDNDICSSHDVDEKGIETQHSEEKLPGKSEAINAADKEQTHFKDKPLLTLEKQEHINFNSINAKNKADLKENVIKTLKSSTREGMMIRMTPWNPSDRTKLREIYTELKIKKHAKIQERTEKVELVDYVDLFDGKYDEPKRILLVGQPGIGKTMFSKKIAFDWAGTWAKSSMEYISIVFFVSLKHISPSENIEDMIIKQHTALTSNVGISQVELKEMLMQHGKECLLILDGYDEIPKNYNKHITELVTMKSYKNCNIILTSTSETSDEVIKYFPTIAFLEGLSKENSKKFIDKLVTDESKRQSVYKFTESDTIKDMWRYPRLVLYLCLIVTWGEIDLKRERLSPCDFLDRLVGCLYTRYITESTKTKPRSVADGERDKNEFHLKLGIIALRGLVSGQLGYRKAYIEKHLSCNAFKSGIIVGGDGLEGSGSLDEMQDVSVYFAHRSIQEYLAARSFVYQLREKGKDIKQIVGTSDTFKPHLSFYTLCDELLAEDVCPTSRMSEVRALFKMDPHSQFVKYVVKSLNTSCLSLQEASISPETSKLLQQVFPRCNRVQTLHLKNVAIQTPITRLLQSLCKSMFTFCIEECTLERHETSHIKEKVMLKKCSNLILKNSPGFIPHLMKCRWPSLTSVQCVDGSMGRDDLKSLGDANKAGFVPRIQSIDLDGNPDISGDIYLLLNTAWPTLTNLNLTECRLTGHDIKAISDAYKRALLPSIDQRMTSSVTCHIPVIPLICSSWQSVEVLDLRECMFSEQDLMVIAEANRYGQLPSVKVINVKGNKQISGHMKRLLCSIWPNLKILDVQDTELVQTDLSAIAAANKHGLLPSIDRTAGTDHIPLVPVLCGAFKDREELDLRYCTFSNDELIIIQEAKKSGQLPSVKEINLNSNKNISGLVASLLAWPWPALEVLNFQQCCLTREDIESIGKANESGVLAGIKHINMNQNSSVSGNVKLLLNCPWKELKTLTVLGCNLTIDDVLATQVARKEGLLPKIDLTAKLIEGHISLVPVMCCLYAVLDLKDCKLSSQDLDAIVEANEHGLLRSVKEINLDGKTSGGNCNVTDKLAVLLDSKWQSVEKLHLQRCALTENDVRSLGKANIEGLLPCLNELGLGHSNNVSKEMSAFLANPWPVLEKIILEHCGLTKQNIQDLGKANEQGMLPNMKHVILNHNSNVQGCIDDLLRSKWSKLETLDLLECSLTSDDMSSIDAACENGILPSIDRTLNVLPSGHIPVIPLLCGSWCKQQTIDLRNADMQDIFAIAKANKLGLLSSVKEIYCSKTVSGLMHILLGNAWPRVKQFDVFDCNLTQSDIACIRVADKKGFIPSINVEVNSWSSGHVPVFPVLCGSWKKLEVLDLRNCDEQDIITIAEANKESQLLSVREILASRNISGCMSALLSSTWPMLKTFDVFQCDLTEADISAIGAAYKKGYLSGIDVKLESAKPGLIPLIPVMSGAFKSQEVLDLRNCENQDILAVAEANRYGQLPSVKEINLNSYIFCDSRNISGQLTRLLGSPWQVLLKIDLGYCNLNLEDIRCLGTANSNKFLPCLKQLELAGIEALSGSLNTLLTAKWKVLEHLELAWCKLIVRDAEFLGKVNHLQYLPCLKGLNLKEFHDLSGPGLVSLLSDKWLNLQELIMPDCSLSSDDCQTLVNANKQKHFPRLTGLHIGSNPGVAGNGLSIILNYPWSLLERMAFQSCDLTSVDCHTLVESCKCGYLPVLKMLNMENNPSISGTGLAVLLSHKWLVLQELTLSRCSLTSPDGETLLEAYQCRKLPQLKILDIGFETGFRYNTMKELKKCISQVNCF